MEPTNNSRFDSLDASSLPDSQAEVNGIFGGKIFTVSGYQKNNDQLELINYIKENGGTVMNLDGLRKIHYAVVDLNGQGTASSKALHLVTHVFIEECIQLEVRTWQDFGFQFIILIFF